MTCDDLKSHQQFRFRYFPSHNAFREKNNNSKNYFIKNSSANEYHNSNKQTSQLYVQPEK
ncbi:hypothetical protein EC2845650_0726 [Escherichia coli 2845650]|nr:hypothetical protein EC2845650_0726 [Escherichia coli 2845650]